MPALVNAYYRMIELLTSSLGQQCDSHGQVFNPTQEQVDRTGETAPVVDLRRLRKFRGHVEVVDP